MRTNYPLDKIVRRKNDGRRRLIFSIGVIVVVVFLVASSSSVRLALNRLLITFTKPLWVMEDNTLVLGGDLFKFLRSHKGLVEENRELKTKLATLQTELLVKGKFEADYRQLAELVDASVEAKPGVVATVIAKPSRSPYDILILKLGDGAVGKVFVGNLVSFGADTALGKITTVSGSVAQAELFSAPGVTTQVLIGEHRLQATSTGRGGGNLLVELPRGLEVVVGDSLLLASGERQLVGVVGLIDSNPSEPTQKITARLPTNIYQLNFVTIHDR